MIRKSFFRIVPTLLVFLTVINCHDKSNPFDTKTKLQPPSNLRATQLGENIRLSWDASADIKSKIDIERKVNTDSFRIITALSDMAVTGFLDTTVVTDMLYTYRLVGYSDQNRTDYSKSAQASAVFARPYNLSFLALDDVSIMLQWQDSCSFENGFEIYRKAINGEEQKIDFVNSKMSSYTDKHVELNTPYSYRIRAFARRNYSRFSEALPAKTEFPGPVPLVVTPVSSTALKLLWNDIYSFEAGFIVERKDGESLPWNQIAQLRANTKEYVDYNLSPGAIYYYRVKAFTGSNSSEYTNIAGNTTAPTPPDLLYPPHLAVTRQPTMQFRWAVSPSIAKYAIEISRSNVFNGTLISDSSLYTDSYSAAALPDGDFFWRVKAKNNHGVWSEWSELRQFTIDATGPSSPTLLTPVDITTVSQTNPVFKWSAVTDAVVYHIQIDDQISFSSPIVNDSSLTRLEFQVTLNTTSYYWRVRCRDQIGNWGNWCVPWSLTINPAALPAPQLSSPINGVEIDDRTPTFDWSDISGAVTYQLQVAANESFVNPIIDSAVLTTSQYTSPLTLEEITYYWRVRAKNNANVWGNWATREWFKIKKVIHPALLSNCTVSPLHADISTNITATVDYYQQEKILPAVSQLYLSGKKYNLTFSGNGLAWSGTYQYVGTLPEGDYNHYFYFEDSSGNYVKCPAGSAGQGPTIDYFYDNFDDGLWQDQWYPCSCAGKEIWVDSGQLHIKTVGVDSFTHGTLHYINPTNDFFVETLINQLAGPDNMPISIRAFDTLGAVLDYDIFSNGIIKLSLFDPKTGKWNNLYHAESSAINNGLGVWNKLKIRFSPSNILLYMNDKFIVNQNESRFGACYCVKLSVQQADLHVSFDNFRIWHATPLARVNVETFNYLREQKAISCYVK